MVHFVTGQEWFRAPAASSATGRAAQYLAAVNGTDLPGGGGTGGSQNGEAGADSDGEEKEEILAQQEAVKFPDLFLKETLREDQKTAEFFFIRLLNFGLCCLVLCSPAVADFEVYLVLGLFFVVLRVCLDEHLVFFYTLKKLLP